MQTIVNNVVSYVRTHLPVILPSVGAVYAVLVQQNVISNSNKLVSVVVAILSALGVTVLHVRQQSSLSAKG